MKLMMLLLTILPNLAIGFGVLGCLTYLISSIIYGISARRRLEQMLTKDKDVIERGLKNYKVNLQDIKTDRDYEIALILIRQEIEKLSKDYDKIVMRKTIDTKSFFNQKQYVNKILHESGLVGANTKSNEAAML